MTEWEKLRQEARLQGSFGLLSDAFDLLEAEHKRLLGAAKDALEGLQDMIGYVDEYFKEKWDHQGYIDRLRAVLEAKP